jgi:hypothetical protein
MPRHNLVQFTQKKPRKEYSSLLYIYQYKLFIGICVLYEQGDLILTLAGNDLRLIVMHF